MSVFSYVFQTSTPLYMDVQVALQPTILKTKHFSFLANILYKFLWEFLYMFHMLISNILVFLTFAILILF